VKLLHIDFAFLPIYGANTGAFRDARFEGHASGYDDRSVVEKHFHGIVRRSDVAATKIVAFPVAYTEYCVREQASLTQG
jgi:hypothetical protein